MLSRLELGHPSDCQHCHHLRVLTRKRIVLEQSPRIVAVQTWCRICGVPVLLEVTLEYEFALRNFYALDDQAMTHKTIHAEQGGWGVHWRLDEVLTTIFPFNHTEVCWPRPPWYEHSEGEDQSIAVVDPTDLVSMERMVDMELVRLRDMINKPSRTREQLEELVRPVLDTVQFSELYEVVGFRAPFVIVTVRATGKLGTMLFQNHPRYFFSFSSDRVI